MKSFSITRCVISIISVYILLVGFVWLVDNVLGNTGGYDGLNSSPLFQGVQWLTNLAGEGITHLWSFVRKIVGK